MDVEMDRYKKAIDMTLALARERLQDDRSTDLIEPSPDKAYKRLNPREYEDTKRIPHFIIFKFRKA